MNDKDEFISCDFGREDSTAVFVTSMEGRQISRTVAACDLIANAVSDAIYKFKEDCDDEFSIIADKETCNRFKLDKSLCHLTKDGFTYMGLDVKEASYIDGAVLANNKLLNGHLYKN